MSEQKNTTVGQINEEVLAFTAGRDVELDRALIEVDCIGTAAHVTMLSRMPVDPPLFSADDVRAICTQLHAIIDRARRDEFEITLQDQDVHLAVERTLTAQLGDLGKKVHTARSRNDQVALDLRLFAKQQLLGTLDEVVDLAQTLSRFGAQHQTVPMVGRTHMQPGMPSSVGLWACAFADSLIDDIALLQNAYHINDQSPLGSAASYGVPLPIDRHLVADLLDFARPVHSALHANNARGKMESIILSAMSQVMLTLSRLAQDLMLFTMPEFAYFTLPAAYCTGSSIMPQKRNPDILELVRAKASRVLAHSISIFDIVKGAPSGYNRDLQEAKEPFMEGIQITRTSLRIMRALIEGLAVNRDALLAGFTPDVFATDRALELVGEGMPFRDAYHHVKANLSELAAVAPQAAIDRKTHFGATAGLDWTAVRKQLDTIRRDTSERRIAFQTAIDRLLAG
jgi:argininosuccinate lyase